MAISDYGFYLFIKPGFIPAGLSTINGRKNNELKVVYPIAFTFVIRVPEISKY